MYPKLAILNRSLRLFPKKIQPYDNDEKLLPCETYQIFIRLNPIFFIVSFVSLKQKYTKKTECHVQGLFEIDTFRQLIVKI